MVSFPTAESIGVEVPEGTPSDLVYLIEMDEDVWFSCDDQRREFCWQTWLKKAKPLKGIKLVTLKLYPDELFPARGKEAPYVHESRRIEREPEQGFTVRCEVVVRLKSSLWSEYEVLAAVRQYPKGTRWRIESPEGDWLKQGTV